MAQAHQLLHDARCPAPATALPSLRVDTVAIDDPGPLLSVLPDAEVASWVRHGEGLVGWGVAARWSGWGPNRFRDARGWLAELGRRATVQDAVQLPGSGLVAFGAFAFGADQPDDPLRTERTDGTVRASMLVAPSVVLGHRDGRWWLTTASADAHPVPLGLPQVAPHRPIGPVQWQPGACTAQEWAEVVRRAIDAIDAGRAGKVVLARDVVAQAGAPIDQRTVLRELERGYPSCWTFAVDGLLGATPELLVRVERGVAESRVLAGTVRRDEAGEERDLAAALMASAKDRQEHEFSVRSVQGLLAPHCRSLQTPDVPFVLSLPNVLHLASDLRGEVADGSTSLQLAEALHPTAAVCGSPQSAAAALIDELEPMRRGRYAGPVGWQSVDGDGEWGIALRCGEVDATDPSRLRLFAGAGIVAQSDPAAEIAETDAKFRPMIEALRVTG